MPSYLQHAQAEKLMLVYFLTLITYKIYNLVQRFNPVYSTVQSPESLVCMYRKKTIFQCIYEYLVRTGDITFNLYIWKRTHWMYLTHL